MASWLSGRIIISICLLAQLRYAIDSGLRSSHLSIHSHSYTLLHYLNTPANYSHLQSTSTFCWLLLFSRSSS